MSHGGSLSWCFRLRREGTLEQGKNDRLNRQSHGYAANEFASVRSGIKCRLRGAVRINQAGLGMVVGGQMAITPTVAPYLILNCLNYHPHLGPSLLLLV